MEMLGLVVGSIISSMAEYCDYHRGTDEHVKNLKRRWEVLESRKEDLESRLEAELRRGKKQKKEVELWLGEVHKIKDEINIEQVPARWKFLSRMRMGECASKKTKVVEDLLIQASNFTDSLVVDLPESIGEMIPASTLVGESTTQRTMEEIRVCLLDDNDVRKIGVYGMGGIGKTTVMKQIHNLLLKETEIFDKVIWVTVSKEFDLIKLQSDIASKLNIDLSKFDDVITRATKLNAELEYTKRYVLILDDMWEAFALEEVGIPEPTPANGCKLVLTTRNLSVCVGMSCKSIKMELLSKEEARKLFLDKLGHDVFNAPNLKAIAEEVLEKCAQLPLAIVTTAASFKCLTDDFEWRDALEELRTSVKGFNNKEQQVLETLKFSYDRLEGERLKQCLLHCALHPEDFEIGKQELIEHLIDEGIIKRRNSRQAEFDRGYSMLKKLENACLLENGIYKYSSEKFVKMHDLVRDMVLWVASPQFKVEGHLGLEDFSDEGKWGEDLVKASLMYNNISRIPPNASPMCPKLSTLLLQGITEVPDGLEMLVNLRYLDLNAEKLKIMPSEILPKLSRLQYLAVSSESELITVKAEEVASLKNLETFGGLFSDIYEYSTYIRSLEKGRLASYEIQVGKPVSIGHRLYLNWGKKVVLENCNISRGEESFVLPKDVHDLEIGRCNNLRCLCDVPSLSHATELKSIFLFDCQGSRAHTLKEKDASAQVAPHTFSRLKGIHIDTCGKLKKLLTPGLLLQLHNMEHIDVGGCEQLEEIIEEEEEEKEEEGMDTTKITLPRLKKLTLQWLPELKSICSSSKVISCDSLEKILIYRCPKLKRFPLSLPLLNGQLSPPPSLKHITAKKEWWESLEWDCQDTKNVLQPFFSEESMKNVSTCLIYLLWTHQSVCCLRTFSP
uniref:AAA+ ATPase domain-containing protein n=1 Tax=Fagus sylvatica TaxID=28930 RepID=A0A2N9HA76_FAGSY